jgi:hypothetical protein
MNPDHEIRAERWKSGERMADLAIACSALFISLCSLGLSIHYRYAMDRLVEANSEPVLEFQSGNRDPRQPTAPQGVLYFSAENPGSGTARIEWFKMQVDGHDARDWHEALGLVLAQAVAAGRVASSIALDGIASSTVAPSYVKWGDNRVLLSWPRTEKNAPLWEAVDRARQSGAFHLTACYCSIFNQCWVADNHATWPREVRSCTAAAAAARRSGASG